MITRTSSCTRAVPAPSGIRGHPWHASAHGLKLTRLLFAQVTAGFSLVDLGAPGRIRTCGTRFRKPLLYPLSYEGLSLVKPSGACPPSAP
jgi:hypothetical protein